MTGRAMRSVVHQVLRNQNVEKHKMMEDMSVTYVRNIFDCKRHVHVDGVLSPAILDISASGDQRKTGNEARIKPPAKRLRR